jgi:hypothetical protein
MSALVESRLNEWELGSRYASLSIVKELVELVRQTGSRLKSRLLGRELASEPRALAAILHYARHASMRILRRRRGILVLSHPKSGRTWLRFMLDRLDVHLAFTHFEEGSPTDWTRQRIILLHRDPRDVLVSSWFEWRFRTGRGEIGFDELLEHPVHGLAAIADFNLHWSERVAEARGLILSYEHLAADPAGTLKRTLAWLDIERTDEVIREAIQAGCFDRMRDLEASGEGARLYGAALAPGNPANAESFKTRRGIAGGWHDHFTEEQSTWANRLLVQRNYASRIAAAAMRATRT